MTPNQGTPGAQRSKADKLRQRILRPVGRGGALWPRLPAIMLVQLLTEFIRKDALLPRVRHHQRPLWHIARHAPVAYLTNAKAARTVLARVIHQDETGRQRMDALAQRQLQPSQRAHFKFTFVRDPFARLASFYMDKVVRRDPEAGFEFYLWGAMRVDLGFNAVARIVCQLPDALADRHFCSQHAMIFPGGEPLVDFVGHLESLPEQFEPIRQRYGLAPLRGTHGNVSPDYDYRDLYTEELVQRVARRYAGDIERFGYQDAHQALLRHVRARRAPVARWSAPSHDSACRDDRTAAMTSRADKLRGRILRPVGRGGAFWPRLPAILLVQLLTEFIRRDALLAQVRHHRKPLWFVAKDAPVAYLTNAKAARTSLVRAMRQDEADRSLIFQSRQHRLQPSQRAHFKFTFVRDPFSRLASFYMDKVRNNDSARALRAYLWGVFSPGLNFSTTTRIVCQIPDALADRHFRSQHAMLLPGGKPLVDFVGRFESLPEQFEPIRQRYGLAPLRRMNTSPDYDYRDLYTEDLVQRVARRYAGDIERFGYQDAHQALLRHVRARRSAPSALTGLDGS